ncbi:MAG: acetylxylan esterase [Bryobacterales bacterium]|nr:acetylxylan esterase [Bryobacterales bacterium]
MIRSLPYASLLVVSLGLLLSATSMPAQQAPVAPAPEDPYQVLGGSSSGGLRSYLDTLAERHFAERERSIAAIQTSDALRQRQRHVRETVLRGFDGWPEKTPLNARIVGRVERDGYRVEKLLFESMPGLFVTANVYVPTNPAHGAGPFPAVLGTAGHHDDGKLAPIYQNGWVGLARRGFVVLAYDPIGQGERLQYIDEDTGESLVGNGTREHIMLGLASLITGTNFARYEVWDGIRAVDYLLTRSDVDATRLAVVGNSGGGTQSAYLNLLEPRLATASPSCYITSWRQLWHDPGPQDSEQVFVDFVKDGFDFADFLTAWAPRPVQMLAAIRDFFPIAGARAAFAETQRMYGLMGATEKTGYFEYDDTHGWSQPRREATYRWLTKWLQGREDSQPEAPFTPEDAKLLHVTEKGQVLLSLGGRSLQQILRERAASQHAARQALSIPDADRTAFRQLLKETLRMLPREAQAGAEGNVVSAIRRDAYRMDKFIAPVGSGGRVPGLLAVPDRAASNARLIVYLDDRGKAAEAGEQGLIAAFAKAGHAVLSIDVRGAGEWAAEDKMVGYTPMYREAMRALLVGTTLAAIQTQDLLAAIQSAPLPEAWRDKPIRLVGKGNMGWIALFAVSLAADPLAARIEGVAAEEALLSYNDIVRSPRHYFATSVVVPGVLKAFDIPDVVASLATKEVLLLNTRAPMEFLHARETVRQEYGSAQNAFLGTNRPEGLQILREAEDTTAAVYLEWLKR